MPDVAHFCQTCGQDMRTPDLARRKSFAVKPDEPVASFALISTIMPRGVGQRPQTYRLALTVALAIALLAAIFGALPIAVMVAAFAIPVVYIVYIYDVNLWEDEPVPVTAMAFGLTGLLTIGFTSLWIWLRGPEFSAVGLDGTTAGGPPIGTFLLVAVAVPIIGEVIRQIGPIILASRPEFDDLMDGLTFGVISGVAYASFDTIVRHWSLLTGGFVGQQDAGTWVSLIFLEGFVKPLIFGTATGIACAEYSGLGRGYDGFTPRYFRGLGEAILANIAYWAGSYLFSYVAYPTLSILLSLIWSLLILAILILRVRNVLHTGLMEAALERHARVAGVADSDELTFCAQCEMPLIQHAAFCNACGTAVRVTPKAHKAKVGVAAGTAPPAAAPTAEQLVRTAESPSPLPAQSPSDAAPPGAQPGEHNADNEEGRA